MSLVDLGTLLITLVLLAITPGIGQLVVAGRTLAYGLRAGVITSIGIGSGDVIYIALVCFGLASLHELFAQLLTPVKWLGAAYLLWMAYGLLRQPAQANGQSTDSQNPDSKHPDNKQGSHFLWGFAVTLGNPKVILFYLGLLPALVDIPSLEVVDVVLISLVALVAVSGVMVAFACFTEAAKRGLGKGVHRADSRYLRYTAAAVLAALALYLVAGLLGFVAPA